MTQNLGTLDRVIRVLIGLALVAWGLNTQSWLFGALALIPFGTALIGWCPLYLPLRLNTKRV